MLTLEIFGFRALWSPYFLFVLILLSIGYFLITVKYRYRFQSSKPLTKTQGTLFILGILSIYIIKGSPIDLMGHIMFYVHMIQMAVLYLIIPQLIIAGIPEWIWRKVLILPVIKQVFAILTKPLLALILFNGVFSFYHIPLIFDVIKTNMWLHGAYTSILFCLAVTMWWPIVNNLEEQASLSGIKKVGYIFANGVLLTPACALIIFSDTPMYHTFSDPNSWAQALELCVPYGTLSGIELSGPEMFNSMSLIHDQQLGGVIMKIIQEIVYGVVLGRVFFEWYRKEQKVDEIDIEMQNAYINPRPVE